MKVGHEIETKRASWSFDGNVAETFVDHVRQSVPLYDTRSWPASYSGTD